MKLAIVVLVFATLAYALGEDLPACVLPCLEKGMEKTSCKKVNWHCICLVRPVIHSAGGSCALNKCGMDTILSMVLFVGENASANWLYS
ncbi:hypothetical protein PEX1_038190 [Penicillium expansum]|uniref:CFEM domain-containing protein n=1 Tax=Penicillium expansum TaxID=27334 RepID=A0A0A2JSG6_PENEN|nr:hypothetical protein PEX2_029630 [Penicillium expansum]KGO39341.1 hypothetical protein PEXP_044220 [Penicillium expansum]KGO55145.1 hypothetical protein PEX2_029630 [Penicillium expansum]KGO63913.1 hypothetical protein PEX1_038190 [Penicillium expansum]